MQTKPGFLSASADQTLHLAPELWQPAVRAHLLAGEILLATIETDLDEQLQFAHGLICLTNQRLCALSPAGAWSEWPLSADQTLKLTDHAGIATDRKSTRLNSSHNRESRMPSSA